MLDFRYIAGWIPKLLLAVSHQYCASFFLASDISLAALFDYQTRRGQSEKPGNDFQEGEKTWQIEIEQQQLSRLCATCQRHLTQFHWAIHCWILHSKILPLYPFSAQHGGLEPEQNKELIAHNSEGQKTAEMKLS